MKNNNFVYLDTETTGLSRFDEVVEIAIVDDNGKVLLDTLVKPIKNTKWPEAQAIHGITPEMVQDSPTLEALLPRIEAAIAGKDVVIYNKAFDSKFIDLSAAKSVSCAMIEYSDNYGEWHDYWKNFTWVNLQQAAYDVGHNWGETEAHRALADTLACRSVWLYLLANEEERLREIEIKLQKRKKQRQYKKAAWEKRRSQLPSNWQDYPYFGRDDRPDGCKTLSRLLVRDFDKFVYAGTCCDQQGNRGHLFIPKK